jgi:hypothetical protein
MAQDHSQPFDVLFLRVAHCTANRALMPIADQQLSILENVLPRRTRRDISVRRLDVAALQNVPQFRFVWLVAGTIQSHQSDITRSWSRLALSVVAVSARKRFVVHKKESHTRAELH